MSESPPRLRMFAGPNGSGKSTLKYYLPAKLLGIYLNPDEIEQEIRSRGFLDFQKYRIKLVSADISSFFKNSDFLNQAGFRNADERLQLTGNRLYFDGEEINSYFASAVTDLLRQKLLEQKASFTFETVMSHPGKVDLLGKARQAGYRTYLYFVGTDDPEINVSRVRNRVMMGGHAVPEDRIKTRYHRSLDLLMEAIRYSDRAYIFDNSGEKTDRKHTWIAEITGGSRLELKSQQVPMWFNRSVLNKIGPTK